MKRTKRFISILLFLIMLFIPTVSALGANWYSSKSSSDAADALALISKQSFKSPMTADRAKAYIQHFINSTGKYVKVPNSGGYSSKATDGTYSVTFRGSAKGCMHYASFISYVMYGGVGTDEPTPAKTNGLVTAQSLKTLLQTHAQAGEVICFNNYTTHSLVYISGNDTGFYTLQWYGDGSTPFLSFSTYEYFANEINRTGKTFCIFNVDTTVNSNGSENTNVSTPAAPANVRAAQATSTTASISWNASSGATSYAVQYYSRTSQAWLTDPDYKNAAAVSYTTTGLGSYDSYQFRVRAVNSAGASAWTTITYSKTASTPATTLTVTGSASRYSGTTSDRFDFYATTNIAAARVTLMFNGDSTVYTMSSSDKRNWSLNGNSLRAGNRTITITAYDSNGVSKSAAVYVTVTAPVPPAAPAGVKATQATSTTAAISWSASSGAASYQVQYYSRTSQAWLTDPDYKNAAAISYTTTGLGSYDSYQFRIRAVNSAGASAWTTFTYNKTVSTPATTLSVSGSASRYSGSTSDRFDFYASTNIAAARVTLMFNGDSTVYTMSSSDKRNWSLNGNTLRAGNRTITITAYDSNGVSKSAAVYVTVTAPAESGSSVTGAVQVTGLTVNATDIRLGFGQDFRWNAIVSPADASNKKVIFSSSDTSVASVDSNGLVLAKSKSGQAYITVRTEDSGFLQSAIVTVASN